ncbi:MAG: hypothetical protein GY797_34655, partial [Deltaproteobacteria bacterium]|nr:hypothetical protein [Deltaproteobacteria bacterium]
GSWEELDYPSQSEADQALCNNLAYWTNGNTTGIDQIFRHSCLYREKWNRKDYRERTIRNALSIKLQEAQKKLQKPSSCNKPTGNGSVLKPLSMIVNDIYDNPEGDIGFQTPFQSLNRHTGGLKGHVNLQALPQDRKNILCCPDSRLRS